MHAGHGMKVPVEDTPEVSGVFDFGIRPPTVGTRFVVHDTPQSVRGDKGPPAEFFDAGTVFVGVVEVFVTTL